MMLGTITPWLLTHFEWDFFLWLCFFAGQCFFMLKRSGYAIRSKLNPIKSRRQYIYQNWDILLIRIGIEMVAIYYPWRHGDLPAIFAHFGWTVPFTIPKGGMAAAGLGYLSDSGLDWLGSWSKAPVWLRENIPQLPFVIQTTDQTTVIHTSSVDVNPTGGTKQ